MYVQAHLLETTRSIPPSSAVGAAGWIELAYVRASGPAFVRARAVPPRAARRTRRRGHELPRAAPQPAARRDHGQIDGRAGPLSPRAGPTSRQGLQNRWEPVRFDRLPVKPVRPGFDLGRYQTGPNSKFKFEFKKMKNSQKILQGATNLMVSNFLKNSFI